MDKKSGNKTSPKSTKNTNASSNINNQDQKQSSNVDDQKQSRNRDVGSTIEQEDQDLARNSTVGYGNSGRDDIDDVSLDEDDDLGDKRDENNLDR